MSAAEERTAWSWSDPLSDPVSPRTPADGFCVCDDGPARDCGVRAHRDAANPVPEEQKRSEERVDAAARALVAQAALSQPWDDMPDYLRDGYRRAASAALAAADEFAPRSSGGALGVPADPPTVEQALANLDAATDAYRDALEREGRG